MTSQPLLTTSPTQAQRDQRPDHRGAIARRKADIGAREHREVGWFTLCNIPRRRAIFAESPEGWVS